MRVLMLGSDLLTAQMLHVLLGNGHRVTIMSHDTERLDTLREQFEVDVALRTRSLMEDLRGVGINNVDILLALSADDNENAMAAQVASHIFHVPDVICRVDDPERHDFYKNLGMNVVCPPLTVVDSINNAFRLRPEAVER